MRRWWCWRIRTAVISPLSRTILRHVPRPRSARTPENAPAAGNCCWRARCRVMGPCSAFARRAVTCVISLPKVRSPARRQLPMRGRRLIPPPVVGHSPRFAVIGTTATPIRWRRRRRHWSSRNRLVPPMVVTGRARKAKVVWSKRLRVKCVSGLNAIGNESRTVVRPSPRNVDRGSRLKLQCLRLGRLVSLLLVRGSQSRD